MIEPTNPEFFRFEVSGLKVSVKVVASCSEAGTLWGIAAQTTSADTHARNNDDPNRTPIIGPIRHSKAACASGDRLGGKVKDGQGS